MKLLNDNEQALAHKILNHGFNQVVNTFSGMSQKAVKIQSLDIRLQEGPGIRPLQLIKTNPIYMLTTEVIGDLRGKSFLCLEEAEVEELAKLCLPPVGDGVNQKMLTEALLLELDNMLSANVVTHISNFLNVKIFGDVPALKILSVQEAEEEVAHSFFSPTEDPASQWFLLANVEFVMAGSDVFRPSFVWKFTNQFLQAIKEYVNQTTL